MADGSSLRQQRQQPTTMAAAYNDGRRWQGPMTMAVVAYDDKGNNGLQQRQMTTAAYNGGGSDLHRRQSTAVAYANDSSVVRREELL